MPNPTKVIVSEKRQAVHDPFTKAVVGHVLSRIYEGENVQRHAFQAKSREQEYALGPTTEAFTFRDWPEVFQPVLDAGFEPKNIVAARGGLKMHVTLVNPKGPTYKDPLGWDEQAWGKSTTLRDAIVISGGLKPGTGFHFRRGFFRQVCTNGLILEFLGLGNADFNHITFDSGKLAEQLFRAPVVVKGADVLLGEPIGTMAALKRSVHIWEQAGEDDFLAQQPPFIRDLVAPLTGFSEDFRSEAVGQFEMLINNAHRKVHEIDIACALTSAQNRLEKVPARIPFRLLNAQKAMTKLTGILSL